MPADGRASLLKCVIQPVVHHETSLSWHGLTADENGEFHVSLGPGFYRIHLGATEFTVLRGERIEIRSDETLDLGTLETAPLGALEVTVTRPEGIDGPVNVRPRHLFVPRATVPPGVSSATLSQLAP